MERKTGMDSPIGKSKLRLGGGGGEDRVGMQSVNWRRSSFSAEPAYQRCCFIHSQTHISGHVLISAVCVNQTKNP